MLLPCFRNMISAFGLAFLVYFPNVTEGERVRSWPFGGVILGHLRTMDVGRGNAGGVPAKNETVERESGNASLAN